MKVGKEIRSLRDLNTKIISTAVFVGESLRARRYGFFKAVFLGAILANITLLPINVSLGVSQAAVAADDPDPAHHEEMRRMVEAVQSGADTDPVHIDEVTAYLEGKRALAGKTNTKEEGLADYEEEQKQEGNESQQQPFESPRAPSGFEAYPLDTDPARAEQMRSLKRAVESGQDTDPVHAQQVREYFGKLETPIVTPVQEDKAPQKPSEPVQPVPAPVSPSARNPLSGLALYVNLYSPAKMQADSWWQGRASDAQKMQYLASQPTASWFGGWNHDVQSDVNKIVSAAKKNGQAAVLVAYNIPGRDCGGYSAGGSSSRDAYINWIGAFARGIGDASAIVILEPDALPGIDCLSGDAGQTRADTLASAVSILKSNKNTKVYIDAGHSGWIGAGEIAQRLNKAGISKADGFSLNVSNFRPTSGEAEYGKQVSDALGGKHFVIDTSRNGNGSNGEWCNPWGRATGEKPTTNTGNSLVDAYLWVKTPGESDGTCNGGPSAGTWWPDYGLSLVK